jgi:hypothetical protein
MPKKFSLDSGRAENRSASIRLEKPRNSRENERSGDSRSEKRAFRSGKAGGKYSRNVEIFGKTRVFRIREKGEKET